MAPGNLQSEDRRQTENFDEKSKTVTKKRKRVETESLVGLKKRRLNNDTKVCDKINQHLSLAKGGKIIWKNRSTNVYGIQLKNLSNFYVSENSLW